MSGDASMNEENISNTKTAPDDMPVVLITGAARRIGAQIARTLQKNGFRIVIHCNNSVTEADALCSELNALRRGSARFVAADLATWQGCEELINQLTTSRIFDGRLDVLVNNASTFYPTPIKDATEEHWQELMQINLMAPFVLSQKAFPTLKKHRGSIINITDIHGKKPLADYSIYSMSKAGLISMTDSLAKEFAPNVRVNAVSPGAILWPEHEADDIEKQQKVLSKIPLKRMGSAEHIASAVLFLLKNNYVTGQVIKVDGGRSLN